MSMQNFRVAYFVVLLTLAGCGAGSSPYATGPAPTSDALPQFELRDFRVAESLKDSGLALVTGQGVLVAKDDALRKGSHIVWLNVENGKKNESPTVVRAFLRDGIATMETEDYLLAREKEAIKIAYTNWKLLGFQRLQDGVLIEGPTSASASSSPTR